jgi:CDGSH-type Zn-finger protein
MSELILKSNKNGPLFLAGGYTLIDENGNKTELKDGEVYLCRCGSSSKKPFCDGSHKKVGFEGPQFSLERP